MFSDCNNDPSYPFSPINGNEPLWDPSMWESNKKYNNCYAYAINNHKENSRIRKPEPGKHRNHYSCSQIMEGLQTDIDGIYSINFECKCAPGFNKIYAAVSNEQMEQGNDFHFYRLDHDGYWSHKTGSNDPSRLDASGKLITNPELSDRAFHNHNYEHGCGFFCVPLTAQNTEIDNNNNNNNNNNNTKTEL